MSKLVQQQIERIIDEGTGLSRRVIIQMETSEAATGALIRTASQAINTRSLFQSARNVLPPPFIELSAKSRESRRRALRGRRTRRRYEYHSMSAQVAEIGLIDTSRSQLRRQKLDVLKPLISSNFLRSAVRKSRPEIESIPHFWSSTSAALQISKDDLAELPKHVPGIGDVFVNKIVSIPPVVEVEVSQLSKEVQENKASSWGLEKIGALAAWGAYGAEGQGVKVAVLDTGADASHPDLVDKLSGNDWAEFDLDGQVVPGSSPRDSAKHGTHCCGVIAGLNYSGKWIGVAPSASLAAGMVLPKGRGSDAQILAGMQWAIDLGVDVISMSLGGLHLGPEVFDTYTHMIITANQLGIPVVVAIGNEGSQTSGTPGNDYFAFTVGATDPDDRAAGFSGGRTQVVQESRFISSRYLPLVFSKPDLAAPGVGVTSCVPGKKYAAWNGTSMATPHVAGAIAVLLSATDIGSSVEANHRAYVIQDLIMGSVDDFGEAGQDHRYGLGRLNILKAIGYAHELGY